MEAQQERIEKLKSLGAGDEQCAECLCYYGVRKMTVCKQCIADAPAFTEAVSQLMAHNKSHADKTCMNCGTSGCDHKDARVCASGSRSLWSPNVEFSGPRDAG